MNEISTMMDVGGLPERNAEALARKEALDGIDNEMEKYLDDVAMGFCPECGKEVVQNARGRRKRFCSDKCRYAWKNKHQNPENWKRMSYICPVCNKEFRDRGYGKIQRKYCSRSCANHGRAMERRNADGKGTE